MSIAAVAVQGQNESRRGLQADAGRRRARSEALQSPSPWDASHLTWCLALAAIGVVGQIACWYGVSGETTLQDQLPWAGGAVLFASVCVGAGGAWVGVGCFTLRRARRQVFAETRSLFAVPDPSNRAIDRSVIAGAPGPTDTGLVTASTMTMVHRATCLAARGKDVRPISADEAERAGLDRCGICTP